MNLSRSLEGSQKMTKYNTIEYKIEQGKSKIWCGNLFVDTAKTIETAKIETHMWMSAERLDLLIMMLIR